MHFDAHQPQQVNHIRRLDNTRLVGRNHPGGRTFVGSFRDRPPALQIEIFQEAIFIIRYEVHRQKDGGLLHVDVVAQRPFHARLRRIRAKPITLRFGCDGALHRIGNAIAERLVEAANRVMTVCNVEHIVRRPAIIEAMRPHPRHAALSHLFDFVIGEQIPFIDHDWIEPGIVWTSPGRGVKKRHRLMQVMENRRMIFQKRLHLIARKRERHSQSVAIVIVGDVVAPVNERRGSLVRIGFAVVVGIDHPVAPINFQRRSNQDNDVFANRLDERTLFSREAISQFH